MKWQNGLTDLNLPFFEESNAIFTNYTFKEDHLKASQKISGDNSRNIYAGVDVFGRGKEKKILSGLENSLTGSFCSPRDSF